MKLLLILSSLPILASVNLGKDFSFVVKNPEKIEKVISQSILIDKGFKTQHIIDNKPYEVSYTINEKLQKRIERLLRRYRSDHTGVAVIDNNTGQILALTGYQRKGREVKKSLALTTSHPAASIFKVVTAADLLERKKVEPSSTFQYNGKGVTLYKGQVLKERKNRWTRSLSFKKAFALSNNVIFGKAAIKNTEIDDLVKTSEAMGFNKDLLQFIDTPNSSVFIPKSDYGLAELASGFNRETLMSPIHGAYLASLVANNGVSKQPYLVESIRDLKLEREIWGAKYTLRRVLSAETSKKLDSMMRLTVKKGTARSAFLPRKTRRIKNLIIGGKTGSISGGEPYGKRDWFVSYARPSEADAGISVAVMIINEKKWYIKAPYLAKEIIEYYYTKLRK